MLNHSRNRRVAPGANLQRGVGLIEVLIAVVVLSIGLLGMAGLQAFSLRNNQSAYQRGMAVVQAYYIADAMRADLINARNGDFNLAMAAATPAATTFATTSLAAWRASLTEAMGDGATGSVDCDGPLCEIVVQWDDSRAAGVPTTQQLLIEVEL